MFSIFRQRTDTSPDTETNGFAAEPESAAPERHCDIATVERIGSVAVATLTVTELTLDHSVVQLTELLEQLANSGAQHYVLDVQNVQHMDSSCLGCLVEALNRMASSGGKIALVNADYSVQYLFRMTRLDRVFSICQDVPAAMRRLERAGGEAA